MPVYVVYVCTVCMCTTVCAHSYRYVCMYVCHVCMNMNECMRVFFTCMCVRSTHVCTVHVMYVLLYVIVHTYMTCIIPVD